MVDDNRLTLLTEGPERRAALIALIDGAETSLRLLYYIYRGDASGDLVRAALDLDDLMWVDRTSGAKLQRKEG